MADDVGKQLRKLFPLAYSIPTFYLHVSDWSIVHQTGTGTNGIPLFPNPEQEQKDSYSAIVIGCALMELVARRTNSFFRLKRAKECERILNASEISRDELGFGKRRQRRRKP